MNLDQGSSGYGSGGEAAPSLIDICHDVLTHSGAFGWVTHDEGGFWFHLEPVAYRMRFQGWKLHVSAVPASAPEVLTRAMEVLLRHGCAFKFARSYEQVAALVAREADRGSGGKFITAYPNDDEHLRLIAKDLDEATTGLVGPMILSDRPYRPGSLVHYRYGAFIGHNVLSNDGAYESMLVAPDGTLLRDTRQAWFAPPEWAALPLPDAAPVKRVRGQSKGILVANRFVVQTAIRQTNRGGVYRAMDIHTKTNVILKQARASIDVQGSGKDARDLLRLEAELLDRLAPSGIAPAKVELLELDPFVFLVEEAVPGVSLAAWITEKHAAGAMTWSDVAAMAAELVRVLRQIHQTELVHCDFTAPNIMVGPDGRIRIVDLELATSPGEQSVGLGTVGFAPPEQFVADGDRLAVAVSLDLYSLGATLFMLVVGTPLSGIPDRPEPRPLRERIADQLTVSAAGADFVAPLAPLVLGLMEEDPVRRWDLARVEKYLTDIRPAATHSHSSATVTAPQAQDQAWLSPHLASGRLSDQLIDRLVEDGLAYLGSGMTPDQPRLWPTSNAFGATTDPLSVQYGAAGTLSVLITVAREGDRGAGSAVTAAPPLADQVRTAAYWIAQRLRNDRVLPGLYFGRSGPAWVLYEAGRLLGEDPLVDLALALARKLPLYWPNPDICHGSAGAGLTQLHLWRATGEQAFLDRVRRCVQGIVASAEPFGDGVLWQVPTTFDSALAGTTSYGFAHGVAGIGYFLLAAGLVCGDEQMIETACRAGRTLAAATIRHNDRVYWPVAPGDTEGKVHWCNGSSGVGTFLVRLWQATGDNNIGELTKAAAETCRHGLAMEAPAACHGLPGHGEFLLDMAAATGDPAYADTARIVAAHIYTQSALRDGLILPSAEGRTDVGPEFNVGIAGAIAFLHRLRHGGVRPFMADVLDFHPEHMRAEPAGGVR